MNVASMESGLPGCSFCSSIWPNARCTAGSFFSDAKALLVAIRSHCSRSRSVADTNAAS